MRVFTRGLLQLRFDAGELIGQDSLEQRNLAREMSIERFLADTQLLRQVVHGYAAEPMAEEMRPRCFHDSLRTGNSFLFSSN